MNCNLLIKQNGSPKPQPIFGQCDNIIEQSIHIYPLKAKEEIFSAVIVILLDIAKLNIAS